MRIRIDPKVDFAFKFLFGRPETVALLKHFLNAILRLEAGECIVDLTILNPFNLKETETDKLSILDIKACDERGRRYSIEMQMFAPVAFLNRALYYWARLYREQLSEGQDFTELQPTISICLINSVLFRDVEDYHLVFSLREPVHGLLFTDHLQVHIIELPKFQRTIDELANPLDRWLYFLRHADVLEPGELPATLDSPEIQEAYMQLENLSQDDIARELYESRLKEKRDIATLRKVAKEEGRQEGLEQGRVEGFEHGKLIGRIVLCQEELGDPITANDILLAMRREDLISLAKTLRARLAARWSSN